ncbi:3-beta hydroxysteroid dehydrogenase/isomerase family-domain-containing protein [Tricladium varicosporioides]|nr:3-beta hydroxysteroid dehydrogenase/isomerase family-domain-containing protein [Hymenoscyphus varicosporioides]
MPPPIQSALVIGGCGDLGQRLVAELLKLEPRPRVAIFDLQTPKTKFPEVKYHNVDITKKDEVDTALRAVAPQVIFHTASPPPGLPDLALYMKVNVMGTCNLLESAKSIAQAFVYTSSASVIHDSCSDLVEGDDSLPLVYLPEQKELYTHSKAVADQLVLDANGEMRTISIRPSGIFGEGYGTAQAFAERAAAGKLKFQIGNGENLFDFTYVENIVHAHILAAQCLLKTLAEPIAGVESAAGQGFIITNDEHIPFWEFGRAIGNAAGYPTRKEDVRSIPKILGLAMAVIAEWIVWLTSFGRKTSGLNRLGVQYSSSTRTYRIDKAKRILGYRPKVSLQEGILRAGKSFSGRFKKDV